MVNDKNAMAAAGENIAASAPESCASVALPVKIVSVLTTVSFAERPVMSAVEARQSVNPSGAKMGAKNEPMEAIMLWDASSTMLSRASKFCKNQMTMEAANIIVKAYFKKSLAFSHM